MAQLMKCSWQLPSGSTDHKESDCFSCAKNAVYFEFTLIHHRDINRYFSNDAKDQIEKGLEFTRAFIEELEIPVTVDFCYSDNVVSFSCTDGTKTWIYHCMVVFRTFVWDATPNKVLNQAFYGLWKEGNSPSESILKSLIFDGCSTYQFSQRAIYDVKSYSELNTKQKRKLFERASLLDSTPVAFSDYAESAMLQFGTFPKLDILEDPTKSYTEKYETILEILTEYNNLVLLLNLKEFKKGPGKKYFDQSFFMSSILNKINDDEIVLDGNTWYCSYFNHLTNSFLLENSPNYSIGIFRYEEIKNIAKVITIAEAVERNLIPADNLERIIATRFNVTKQYRQLNSK